MCHIHSLYNFVICCSMKWCSVIKSTVASNPNWLKKRYNILVNILISFEDTIVLVNLKNRIIKSAVNRSGFSRVVRNIFVYKEMWAQILR